MGELYMVATPIGNLGDITLRALETLKAVDLIACEDTRRTLQLLNRFSIAKKLISCRTQNEAAAAQTVCRALEAGQSVAYCSDAGTPGVSDPGARLAQIVRQNGFRVVPIPGASAVTALISVSATESKGFRFEGFLSPKEGRRKRRLEELMNGDVPFILYESPFRIIKLLHNIADTDSERLITVGRELTKQHEEIVEGTAEKVLNLFESRNMIKGEWVLLINGKKELKSEIKKTDNKKER